MPNPKNAQISDPHRASLMEAIRNTGGYNNACLKSVDGREIFNHSTTIQVSNYMKEQKNKQAAKHGKQEKQVKVRSRIPGGGNFMADLANKLRR